LRFQVLYPFLQLQDFFLLGFNLFFEVILQKG
jgi:hypothetical protein